MAFGAGGVASVVDFFWLTSKDFCVRWFGYIGCLVEAGVPFVLATNAPCNAQFRIVS